MTTFTLTLAALLLLLTLPVVLLLWATESPEQRTRRQIRRVRKVTGLSQEKLAKRFGVTRHRVRVCLATA